MTRLVIRLCIGISIAVLVFLLSIDWFYVTFLEDTETLSPVDAHFLDLMQGPIEIARERLEGARSFEDEENILIDLEVIFGFPFIIEPAEIVREDFPDALPPPGDDAADTLSIDESDFYLEPILVELEDEASVLLLVPDALGPESDDVLVLGPIADPAAAAAESDTDTENLPWELGWFLLIVAVTSVIILRPVARRVRILEDTAARFGEGDLGARAHIESPGLIGELARRFDAMADQLQLLVDNQRHLLHSVSHEIRTPISRVRFRLELIESAASDASRKKQIQGLTRDLDALEALVQELLSFARFTQGTPRLERVELDAGPTLQRIVDDLPRQQETPIELVDAPAPITLHVDRDLFKRALENLLLNAERYASSRIIVRYASTPAGGVRIEVGDDGPGIPTADRERIFEPFARVDSSRSRSSGGTGLGLAIVQRIVRWHDGEVHVDVDPELGGALFVSTWGR